MNKENKRELHIRDMRIKNQSNALKRREGEVRLLRAHLMGIVKQIEKVLEPGNKNRAKLPKAKY